MRIILAALLLLFLPGSLLAATVSLSDVIDTLEAPFKPQTRPPQAINDFQAEFFQESHIASIDRVQRGRGDVSFKFLSLRQDQVPLAMFRWEYRQPSIQEIVSDGETLWVYIPENRQVIESDISSVTQRQSENPVTFLTGLGNLSRDFHIRWGAPDHDREGNYILELEPIRTSQMIQSLQIVVDHRAVTEKLQGISGNYFPILATSVFDPNGNRTTIEFRDIRVNRNISEHFFRFTRPAGVEVVRPTGEEFGY